MNNSIEQPNYLKNALKQAALGIPIEFLPAGKKGSNTSGWQSSCTTSIEELIKRAEANPDKTNYACVAKAVPGGYLFLDDDGGIRSAFQAAGYKMQPTFKGQSCSGNFHYTYRHSEKSLTFWKSIGKSYIQESKTDGTGELWSLRMHNSYIVGPGSVAINHAGVEGEYRTVYSGEVIEIPDDLLDFLIARWESQNKSQNKPTTATAANTGISDPRSRQLAIASACKTADIPHGSHDTTLTKIGGELRRVGLDQEDIYPLLADICEKHCTGRGDDWKSMCLKISKSVCQYPKGKDTSLAWNTTPAVPPVIPAVPEIDKSQLAPRPVFPLWAIAETSLYEGFVRPVVETSSKNAEFLWLPAVQLMMNYFSDKIRIEYHRMNWNLFIGLVSDPGKYFKSSSCKLAQQYFKYAGLAETYTPAIRNPEGKVIIMQAGSSEGFGLAMSKINSNHAILFNDELGKLVAKAGIENSSMPSDILSWYERDDFGNATTNQKNLYSFPGDTYTFGMCWCTTTRGFNRHWPKLAGVVSGMEDRMFFVVGPEKPKELKPVQEDVQKLAEGALRTRQLVDAAIKKAIYQYEDIEEAQKVRARFDDPRSQGLFDKFALYFCIDLDLECIDSDCLERAGAIVDFRNAASRYLEPIEADNAQARVQCEIVREIKKNGGKMTYRKLCRDLTVSRYGADFWKRAYETLILEGFRAIEFKEAGRRGQVKRMVGIPVIEDED
jgi:hypothetical protein